MYSVINNTKSIGPSIMKLMEILVERQTNYTTAVKMVKSLAPTMKNGGINVTPETLAPLFDVDIDYMNQIINWGIGKRKLSQDVLGNATSDDPVSKLFYGIAKIVNSPKTGRGGLENFARSAGMDPTEVSEIIENPDAFSELSTLMKSKLDKDIRKSWFKTTKKAPIYDKRIKGALGDVIRATMKDLTNNFDRQYIGQIPAHEIATKLGVARTTIDRELSNNPELRDLEAFRVHGKREKTTTDKDREAAYNKNLYK